MDQAPLATEEHHQQAPAPDSPPPPQQPPAPDSPPTPQQSPPQEIEPAPDSPPPPEQLPPDSPVTPQQSPTWEIEPAPESPPLQAQQHSYPHPLEIGPAPHSPPPAFNPADAYPPVRRLDEGPPEPSQPRWSIYAVIGYTAVVVWFIDWIVRTIRDHHHKK